MSTHADQLKAARALIARGWCQGAAAKDRKGVNVACDDPTAVCHCVIGAINAAAPQIDDAIVCTSLLLIAVGVKSETELIEWHDAYERTQADVLKAFDKAICDADFPGVDIDRVHRREQA